MSLKKVFFIIVVGMLSMSALISCYEVLFGDWDDLTFRIISTTLSLAGYSLFGLFCAMILDSKEKDVGSVGSIAVAWSGIVTSILAAGFCMFLIWRGDLDLPEVFWRFFVAFHILAFSLTLLSLMFRIFTDNLHIVTRSFLWMAIVGNILAAIMLLFLCVTTNPEMFGEAYFRILGFFGILGILGTISSPILKKALKPPETD